MPRTQIRHAIDALLNRKGFARNGSTWVRQRIVFSDVIDIQRGTAIAGVTLNVALMHSRTYELVWGKAPMNPRVEPECVVRTRLGHLVDGQDRWWRVEDQTVAADIADALTSAALPFLSDFKVVEDVERWLEASKNRYPPEALYLAAVKQQRGELEQARTILERLHQSATSEWWRTRIRSMAESLA